MQNLIFSVLGALLFSTSPLAQAQLLPPPAQGEYQIRGEFSYFSSNSNYSADGKVGSLPNDSKLSAMQGFGEFIVDLTPSVRVQAGFAGGRTAIDRVTPPARELETFTTAGLSEVWAKGQYWYNFFSFDLVPEAAVYYPLFRIDTTAREPLIGEGAVRVRGGSWLIYEWRDFFPYGYLGYEVRDEGRSSLIPFNIGLQWLAISDWWFQVEARGASSMTDDSEIGDQTGRNDYLYLSQGGSERFYSINPNYVEGVAMVGTHFGQFGAYAGVAHTLAGHNVANGITGFVGLTFDGTVFAPTPRDQKYYDSPNPKKFRVQEESYDDSDLRESNAPTFDHQEPEIQVRRRARSAIRPKAKRRTAPPKTDSMPTLELLMKDTQKTLEKKKSSK